MRKMSENSGLEREIIFSKNREKIAKNETRNAKNRPPTAPDRPTRSADQTPDRRPDRGKSTRCKGYKTVTRLQNGNRGYKTVTKRCKGLHLYRWQDTVNLFFTYGLQCFSELFACCKMPLFRVRGDILHFTRFSRDFPRVSCSISLYPIFSTLTPFFASFSSPLLFVPPLSFHVSLISASFPLFYTLLMHRNEAYTFPRTLATSSNRTPNAFRYLFRSSTTDASEL